MSKNTIKGRDAYAAASPASPVAATTTTAGIVKQAAAVADSTATEVADLKSDYNDLLAALRTAGILASGS